jgi:hypothetical protein
MSSIETFPGQVLIFLGFFCMGAMLMSIAILGKSDRAKNSDNLSTRIVSDSSDCLGATYIHIHIYKYTAIYRFTYSILL